MKEVVPFSFVLDEVSAWKNIFITQMKNIKASAKSKSLFHFTEEEMEVMTGQIFR